MPIEQGKTIGNYAIENIVGHGGMATVYKARHIETDQVAALKTLTRIARVPASGLRREIQILPLLNHPGIVKVFDVGEENGIPWIAMELLSGKSLRNSFNEIESLAEFLHLVRQVCRSLSYLHGNGLIHMDIKPDNIFITDPGFPVLMDFGLIHRFAGKKGREILDAGQIEFGTWEYMAPEILLGELPDARADLYSLGCIMYEFIFGHVPFEGDSVQDLQMLHRTRVPKQPISVMPSIPVPLNNLILRLLALHPSGRPGYAELVEHLLSDFSDPSSERRVFPVFKRPHLFRSPFIARKPELEQFDAALASMKAGLGGCILLAGESGIGKTRILMEMGRVARQAGFPVLLGECQETTISIQRNQTESGAFQGFQRPVETLIDNIREYGLDEWIGSFGEYGRVLADQFHSLAEILPILQQPKPVELSPQAARDRLFHALQLFLIQSVNRTPIVILIDDVHWADELTMQFILYLLRSRRLSNHPLLLVVAFRMEEIKEPIRQMLNYPESRLMRLTAFDKEQVAAMVVHMLAMSNPSSALLNLIYNQSEGNPFFLTEVLKTAVDEGFIYLDSKTGWQLKHTAEDSEPESYYLSMPSSLHDILKKRLKQIQEPAASILAVLAVLGRESSREYLATVIHIPESRLQQGLQELLFQMIIDETDRGTFRFVHEEFRWSAYRRLPSALRLKIHRKAAAVLERMSPKDRMMWFAEMALHCEKSGQIDKALNYYLSAGRQAIRRFVFELAATLYSRYLELAPDTLSDTVQVRLELARDVLMISGQLKRALTELNTVVKECRRKGYEHSLASALRCQANIYWQQGNSERGWSYAHEASKMYDALQSESLQTGLLIDMACAASDAGDFVRAQTLFERCRTILEQTRDNLRLGRLLTDFAALRIRRGQPDKGILLLQAAQKHIESFNDKITEARIHMQLGIAGIKTRDFTVASNNLQTAIEMYRAMGFRRGEALSLFHLSEFFRHEYSYEDAWEFSMEARQIFSDIGDKIGVTRARFQQARILMDSGKSDQVLQELEHCRFQFSSLDDEYHVGLTAMAIAEVLAENPKSMGDVLTSLQEAEAIFRKNGNIVELINCLCLQGVLGSNADDAVDAAAVYDQVVTLVTKNNISSDCLLDREIDKLRQIIAR